MDRAFWVVLSLLSALSVGGALYFVVYDWLAKRHFLAILTLVVGLTVEPLTEQILQLRVLPLTLLGARYAFGLLVFCGYIGWRIAGKEPH